MKRIILAVVIVASPFFYYACGGTSGGDGNSGTVPLYVTDDIGDFNQVMMTLNGVRLVHTGTGTSCELLGAPESVDIANLAGVLQLLDSSECPVRSYNRVQLEFEKNVELMDGNGVTSSCLFESYKDPTNPNQPNVLICNGEVCTIDINGGINVIAGTVNPFGLDFDLKHFEVTGFGLPECRATLKVEPQNNNDINEKIASGYQMSVTGFVSNLDTEADTFTLTAKRGAVFLIDYSQASYGSEPQPDLDGVLQFAVDSHLRVRVMADGIDISDGGMVTATAVYVKMDGLVGDLDNALHLFTLTNSAQALSITVDYTDAAAYGRVDGVLADGSWVESKLYGRVDGRYLAHEVEVENEDAPATDD